MSTPTASIQQQVSAMSEEQLRNCIELLEEDLLSELTDPADHESINAGLTLLRLAAAELAAEDEAYRLNQANRADRAGCSHEAVVA